MTATEITKQLDKEVKTFFNLIQPEIKREHPYPDNVSIQEVNIVDLPLGWNSFPHQLSTRQIGDRLAAENKSSFSSYKR